MRLRTIVIEKGVELQGADGCVVTDETQEFQAAQLSQDGQRYSFDVHGTWWSVPVKNCTVLAKGSSAPMPDNLPSERARVDQVLTAVATSKRTLESLSETDLALVLKAAVFDGLKADGRTRLWLAAADLAGEVEAFLAQAGPSGSYQTRRTYKVCLSQFQAWASRRGIEPLTLAPAGADLFALELQKTGRSPATVRKTISGVSAFYSWLERRHPEIRNPFRRTRARPRGASHRPALIPSAVEVELMLGGALGPLETAAAGVLALRGLRVGSLASLKLQGPRFEAFSKGRTIAGVMPERALELIGNARLPVPRPFEGWGGPRLSMRLYWVFKGLYTAGKVAAQYSAHDLRHFFAVSQYEHSRDIYALKQLLGHSSVAMTERYLRSLGLAG